MRLEVLAWCREQALFPTGGRVVLALSGGADSVAMVHVLRGLQAELGLTVTAAHFNHHLRGAASDADEAFCRTLCAQLEVPLAVGGAAVADEAKRRGLGTEEAARLLRYDFLQTLAAGDRIATAHSADDNLETMLMHLLRGCGLRGLGGIPPRRENIVRPLLCVTRQEIEQYLTAQGLPHVEDATNRSHAYLRNRVRLEMLPALRRELPSVAERALETALGLRDDEAYLSAQAAALLHAARRADGWDAATLQAGPRPLRLRALGQLLRQAGAHDLTGAHLQAADHLLFSPRPAAQIDVPGACLRRQYALLTAQPPDPAGPLTPQRVPRPGHLLLPGGRILVCEVGVYVPGELPYPAAFALAPQKVGELLVRSRLPGDKLRVSGGEKTLRALLIDRKIPASLRGAVPVLETAGRPIAAFGVGADPAFRPAPGGAALLLWLKKTEIL